MSIPCTACDDLGWVCEFHQDRPWGGMCCDERPDGLARRLWDRLAWRVLPQAVILRLPQPERLCGHDACHCGGAGMACRSCNPDGGLEWLHVEAEVTP